IQALRSSLRYTVHCARCTHLISCALSWSSTESGVDAGIPQAEAWAHTCVSFSTPVSSVFQMPKLSKRKGRNHRKAVRLKSKTKARGTGKTSVGPSSPPPSRSRALRSGSGVLIAGGYIFSLSVIRQIQTFDDRDGGSDHG